MLNQALSKVVNPFFSYSTSQFSDNSGGNTASSLIIRSAEPQDLYILSEILADSFHGSSGYKRWFYPLLRMGMYEDLKNRLRSPLPHYICLVAVMPALPTAANASPILVGSVEMALRSFSPWPLGGVQYPYLSNLAVKPECRRQGVAKQLLNACEQTALKWKFSQVYLHVLETNYQAKNLYFQRGYQLEKIESGSITWLFGQPRRLFLCKSLTTDKS